MLLRPSRADIGGGPGEAWGVFLLVLNLALIFLLFILLSCGLPTQSLQGQEPSSQGGMEPSVNLVGQTWEHPVTPPLWDPQPQLSMVSGGVTLVPFLGAG